MRPTLPFVHCQQPYSLFMAKFVWRVFNIRLSLMYQHTNTLLLYTFRNVIMDYKYSSSHLTCLLERFCTTDHSSIRKQVPFIASLCKNVCFSSKLSRSSLSVCCLNPFSSDQNFSNNSVITQDLEPFFPSLHSLHDSYALNTFNSHL